MARGESGPRGAAARRDGKPETERTIMTLRRSLTLLLVAALAVALVGCSSTSKSTRGAAIGAAAGAAAGAVIGNAAGNTAVGAIMGAVVGGAAGAYIGDYMDRQAAEMDRELENAQVERVGEGIKITFNSGILFDVDSAELQYGAKQELDDLAGILKKYNDTEIVVEGHTDATGSEDHNMDLSRRRAESVARYLESLGVDPHRFTIRAYGESQPIATNETAAGRQQNRRVNLAIFANEELKQRALQQGN